MDPKPSATSADDERRQLAGVRAELLREFAGRVSEEALEQRLDRTVHRFDGAPIRSFVPVLAQRSVRLELRRDLSAPATVDLPELTSA